jgi:hypothetical protein
MQPADSRSKKSWIAGGTVIQSDAGCELRVVVVGVTIQLQVAGDSSRLFQSVKHGRFNTVVDESISMMLESLPFLSLKLWITTVDISQCFGLIMMEVVTDSCFALTAGTNLAMETRNGPSERAQDHKPTRDGNCLLSHKLPTVVLFHAPNARSNSLSEPASASSTWCNSAVHSF